MVAHQLDDIEATVTTPADKEPIISSFAARRLHVQGVAAVDRCWTKCALAAERARCNRALGSATVGSNRHQKMLTQDSARLFVFDLAHIGASASCSGAFPQTLRYESKLPKQDERGTALMIFCRALLFFHKC